MKMEFVVVVLYSRKEGVIFTGYFPIPVYRPFTLILTIQ
jgi:hypothetical protein